MKLWLVLIALLAGYLQRTEGQGNILGSCHCNYSDTNPYLTSEGCNTSRICSVSQSNTAFACVMEYIPRPPRYGNVTDFIRSCAINDYVIGASCGMPDDDEFEEVYINIKSEDPFEFTVCCYYEFCNTEDLFRRILKAKAPNITVTETTMHNNDDTPTSVPLYAIVTIPVLSVFVLLTMCVMATICFIHVMAMNRHGSIGTQTITTGDSSSYGEQSLNDLLGYSGSGAGLPLLVQRSIAGQINLHELIGKGRYGEVWKGSYKCDEIAVKIFHTTDEASWAHEVDIYQTCLFRHPNILRFIASDSKDMGVHVEHWLIMEFCEFGSLYDLLVQRSLEPAVMVGLAYTAVCGLDHLHTEICGHEAKPAIVHRDLKSRNIMVKTNYSCCIGDLGLALRYDRAANQVEDPPTKRVGTKRYLAPEIIDESIAMKHFESFKRADIYSFGLILWEITMRGEIDGVAEEYQMPYQNLVPTDPTFEDMKKIVVLEKRRPTISNKWMQSELFRAMSKLIEQCWMHQSDARLTSLRLKKSLLNLQTSFKDNKENKEQSA